MKYESGGKDMQIELKYGEVKGIVETRGGELVSFNKDGKEYIWSGDPAYWTGRNPNLFPVVGNLKDGKIMKEFDENSMEQKQIINATFGIVE